MSQKYKLTSAGITNLKTNTLLKSSDFKKKNGDYKKRFIKYITEFKVKQLNEVVSKYNINYDTIISLIKQDKRKFIYDKQSNKFYDKKTFSSSINMNNRILKDNVLLTTQESTTLINSYEVSLSRQLYSLSNGVINKLDIDLTKITMKKLVELVKDNVITNKLITINLGDNYYTLSNNFLGRLKNLNLNQVVRRKTSGSDAEFYFNNNVYNKATIELIEPQNIQPDGGFFKYYNITKFDFSRYGIFKKEDIKKDTYIDNCLYIALKNGGLHNDKLTKFKTFVNNRNVPICKLHKISEELDISINLTRYRTDNKTKTEKYGISSNIFNIGLLEEHYFIIEDTNINSFCIKNYNEVKDIEDCNRIYQYKDPVNKTYKKKDKYIDSFKLITLLLKNKEECLKLISSKDLNNTQYSKEILDFDNLDYDEKDYKLVSNNDLDKYSGYYKIFFDFETWTDKNDKYLHKPYCVCIHTENNEKEYFYGPDCGKKMLNYITRFGKNIMLIAHNAKYDYMFLSKYLFMEKPLLKDGNFYTSEARYYYGKDKFINVFVKDSYKLISMPLRKFGKCFNLDVSKEIMPYDLYNEENPLNNKIRQLDNCLKYIKEKEYNEFVNNCIKFKCIYDDSKLINNINDIDSDNYSKYNVDIIKYSRCYCEIDCEVLKKGYFTFKDWMYQITGLNIDNIITIASLAHKYMINEGVYNGVYQISGIPREFIQKCVVGGRVMCNSNNKQKFSGKMADYDACSLYPSSMDRLGDVGGYLMGLPKILKDNELNMDFLNKQDGYFIKIKVNKINKNYDFPLLSKLDNGIRNFTNELDNEYIYIDKISLEDVINFQGLEFDIIQGYYFNEGRNPKIKSVINFLYNERKKKKALKNPIQECYKLIMNSAYGKTILKPSNTKSEVVFVKNFNKFIGYNYNRTREIKKIDDNKYLIETYQSINNQFNMVHIGCEVLSMSKRIMNEVMCLAEDNNIKLYYQDTDSIHIEYDNVEKLENLYLQKYNRILKGSNMGNFHIDFDLDGADSDIYAINSVFLGKKCYIDELECVNKNGDIVSGYHIRMKGVSGDSIKYECDELGISPLELYNRLYEGEEFRFDLTCGGSKCCFEFNKLSSVSTKSDFVRSIKF